MKPVIKPKEIAGAGGTLFCLDEDGCLWVLNEPGPTPSLWTWLRVPLTIDPRELSPPPKGEGVYRAYEKVSR